MWHYLNENPDDLPPEKEVVVLVKYKSQSGEETVEYATDLGTRKFNGNWVMDIFREEDGDEVVGWCEYPEVNMEKVK